MHRMYKIDQWVKVDTDKVLALKGRARREIELEVLCTDKTIIRLNAPNGTHLLWAGQGREKIVFTAHGDALLSFETDGEVAYFTVDGDKQHRVSEAVSFTRLHERQPSNPDLAWVVEQAEKRAMRRMAVILEQRDRDHAAAVRVAEERARAEAADADTGGKASGKAGEQPAPVEPEADSA